MVISLTTTPMMCARLLTVRREGDATGRFHRWSEAAFEGLLDLYRDTLAWALRHSFLMIISLLCTVVLNVWLFLIIPKNLFPQEDTGRLTGGILADQSISFQRMSQKLRQFMQIVQEDPDVDDVVGFTGGRSANTGFMFISTKPLSKRKASSEQIIARLRPKLARVPGAQLFLFAQQETPRAGGRVSNSAWQYTLQSDNLDDLRTWTPKLMDALKNEPALTDLNSDQLDKGLETDLVIDRDTASRLELTAAQIDNTLYDAFGQRQVSTIYESLNQYHVVMVVAQRYWQDPSALRDIYVSATGGTVSGTQSTNAVAGTFVGFSGFPIGNSNTKSSVSASSVAADTARNASINAIATTGNGSASTGEAVSTLQETMVPLSAFSHYGLGTTPLAVNHQGTFVAGTISFNLVPEASLSDAVEAVDREAAAIHMPATIHGGFQGTAKTFQQTLGNEPVLILAAIVAIYLVLGILYESYAHPFTILSTLPSSGLGAFLALMMFRLDFSVIALIGVLLLIGIVKKNAIMMIDFAIEAEREEGLSPRDAIFKACQLRFRPILMTTMAAILGAVPLAIGYGDGAELRQPLGISIVGGLVVSQLLTLYTTPVVYLYIDRARTWLHRTWVRLGFIAPDKGPQPAPLPV
jgi:multidrug efflux pump